ncbi:undecaprenyl-phosphate galactose phosphotransferase WbaP [Thermovibrio ammonificans]
MKWHVKLFKRLLLLVTDLAAFYSALLLAFYIRKSLGESLLPHYQITLEKLLSFWWFPAVYIIALALYKLYTEEFPFWEETRRLVKASTIATVIIFSLAFLSKQAEEISRTTVVLNWLFSLITLPLFRFAVKSFLHKLPVFQTEVTLIGENSFIKEARELLEREKFWGYKVKEALELTEAVKGEKLPDTSVVICSIPKNRERAEKLTALLQSRVNKVLFLPSAENLSFLHFEAYPLPFRGSIVLSVENNLKNRLNRFLKRTIDIVLSALLLVLLSPFLIAIALIIKLTSKGPVFFSHERVGERGKLFKVLKFRSMYPDAQERLAKLLQNDPKAKEEWERTRKLKNDPRVTPIGRFLRKTSLDELPQLINVLKGEMSLVGPRPVTKEEIEKYYGEFAQFYYMVKPGITGLWQVSGRNNLDYAARVKLDTWYVSNWSLWLDLMILVKTIKAVLKKEGAY